MEGGPVGQPRRVARVGLTKLGVRLAVGIVAQGTRGQEGARTQAYFRVSPSGRCTPAPPPWWVHRRFGGERIGLHCVSDLEQAQNFPFAESQPLCCKVLTAAPAQWRYGKGSKGKVSKDRRDPRRHLKEEGAAGGRPPVAAPARRAGRGVEPYPEPDRARAPSALGRVLQQIAKALRISAEQLYIRAASSTDGRSRRLRGARDPR